MYKELGKIPDLEYEKKKKKGYLQKRRNGTTSSIIKDTPAIAKLLSFQISLNWIFKLAAPTVTAQ